MLFYAIIIAFLGVTLYTANQVARGTWTLTWLRGLWYVAIGLMAILALLPLQTFFLSDIPGSVATRADPALQLPAISVQTALATGAFAASMALISIVMVNSEAARVWLAQRISANGSYNPDSVVHTTAIVLMALLMAGVAALFALSGGLAGMAESIATSGVEPSDTVLTAVLQVAAAALGVGYAIRRDGAQLLARLGLNIPTLRDVGWGVGIGLGLLLLAIIFGIGLTLLLPPEQLAEQTQASEQLALAFSTVSIALLVAVCASVGEEIFVRGALQPVFGIGLSSGFFTLLHTQYWITPGLLLIFGVSVAFGLTRQRFNTTTAVIAHFMYNFVQLLIVTFVGAS
ncbi:MAG: CPBP family intramembrane metalloprotease [Armatimonadetes bacterium]|nr:CPBP family intramembrane metalloprotease [Anaerolineae bacterium]